MNAFGKGKKPTVGITSILERSQSFASQAVTSIEPAKHLQADQITPNPNQPRKFFDTLRLEELAQSIKEQGILQPLMVRPLPTGRYEIVFGERRYRAALIAGVNQIPVIVRELSDSEVALLAAVENLQREDLNRYDEVFYKVRLVAEVLDCELDDVPILLKKMRAQPEDYKDHVKAVEDLFSQIGREKWLSFVVNGLPVLKLPERLKDVVRSGELEYSKANLIARTDDKHHESLLHGVIRQRWSQEVLRSKINELKPTPDASFSSIQHLRRNLSPRRMAQLEPEQRKKVDELMRQLSAILS
jgi:ParB family chromosome partitioning protein